MSSFRYSLINFIWHFSKLCPGLCPSRFGPPAINSHCGPLANISRGWTISSEVGVNPGFLQCYDAGSVLTRVHHYGNLSCKHSANTASFMWTHSWRHREILDWLRDHKQHHAKSKSYFPHLQVPEDPRNVIFVITGCTCKICVDTCVPLIFLCLRILVRQTMEKVCVENYRAATRLWCLQNIVGSVVWLRLSGLVKQIKKRSWVCWTFFVPLIIFPFRHSWFLSPPPLLAS